MCGRAAEDSRLSRYPRLPMHVCPAYAPDLHGQNPQEEKS